MPLPLGAASTLRASVGTEQMPRPSGRRLMPRRGRSHGCVTHVVCSGCEVGTAPWIVASRGRPLLETKPLVCVEFILSFSSTQSHRPTNLPVGNSSMSPADLVLSTERGLRAAPAPRGVQYTESCAPQRSDSQRRTSLFYLLSIEFVYICDSAQPCSHRARRAGTLAALHSTTACTQAGPMHAGRADAHRLAETQRSPTGAPYPATQAQPAASQPRAAAPELIRNVCSGILDGLI